ncbi:MAG: bifunctional adenosylcobinamide kinase/adenosylcobinamide-phosphate guanylyltransferase [Pseudomonadota bacterium]
MTLSDEPLAATLVLGGARSGKTRRALALAETRSRPVYIATAEAFDDEMAVRIAAHRAERGEAWQTVEAPLGLSDALDQINAGHRAEERIGDSAIVIDCLTLWLSNLMHADRDIARETDNLLAAIERSAVPVILVSNEVGLGIVPDNAMARAFRDHQGRLNQAVAAAVPVVEFVTAGLPRRLKP